MKKILFTFLLAVVLVITGCADKNLSALVSENESLKKESLKKFCTKRKNIDI